MAHQKKSVDQTAEEYWITYFGPYGKQFVGKVPRRVAQAIAQRVRTASKFVLKKAQIGALGFSETSTGGLLFEGVFRGTGLSDGRPMTKTCVFSAEFTPDGEFRDLQIV